MPALKKRNEMMRELKMPPKRAAEQEAEMDLAVDAVEDVAGAPSARSDDPEFMADESAEMPEMLGELDSVSDDILMAEMKRRGLTPSPEPQMEMEKNKRAKLKKRPFVDKPKNLTADLSPDDEQEDSYLA